MLVTLTIDRLDARLIGFLREQPRAGLLEAARRLGVARGTVQSRLDRLLAGGVVASLAPTLDPSALGFGVTAFVTLEIRQATGHAPVRQHLAAIPEVLEAHTITGSGDVLARVVARSNADLERLLYLITGSGEVERASSVIALATEIPARVLPLLRTTQDDRP